jgi:hypothetical protein
MQNDRYKAEQKIAGCVWCFTQYRCGESHARLPGTFCSRKCEIEARYWLFTTLKSLPPDNKE